MAIVDNLISKTVIGGVTSRLSIYACYAAIVNRAS
jgi:hypothetical protein